MSNALCFLAATRSNYFMTEVLSAVAAAAQRYGVATSWSDDLYPPHADGTIYVVIPHEFFPLVPRAGGASELQVQSTVGLCVEQPGTIWFEVTCQWAARLGAMLALHPSAARELDRRGIPASHFPLGYVPEWDAWQGAESVRPIDVVYLGSHDERRAQLLASYGSTLWAREQQIVLAWPEPKPNPEPSFLVGADKHELLRSSRLMLNLHRDVPMGLEWVRVLEAMCNGTVVVSEHSRDCAPLIPGKHFVSGRAQDLALLADLLLDDDDRLAELRASAYELVRESLPIERSIDRLLAVAETLPAAPPASRPSPRSHSTASNPDELAELVMAAADRELQPIRAALKGVTIDMLETRRALSMLQVLALGEDPQQPLVAAETESYGAVRPRVSVAISLHNYALEIVEALDSVAASEHDAFEILILDDASVDDSAQVVSSYLADRPWLPARLLRHRANRGLGRTRNALVAQARGDFVFILDADNTVYPTALARLEAGLTEDPEASFAYAVSAILVNGEPQGLLSRHAWDPARLRDGNYIDAMALIRRDRLIEIGGYGEDPRLLGCEDYDLWCRFAEAGQRGVHVPQMLTTYSSRADGMVESVTKLDLSVVLSLIAARSPCLFAGPVNG